MLLVNRGAAGCRPWVEMRLSPENGGNVRVILASGSVALEGRKVLLSAPGFRRELTFNRVREDQVGARAAIKRSERESLPSLSAGALVLHPLEGE